MSVLAKPIECQGCPLYQIDKLGFSQVEGTGINKVLIIGEALGSNERSEGLPFRPTAEAGSLLERCLRLGGWDRQQFALWNVLGCQPPDNKLDGAWYEQQSIEHCKVHFDRVISQFHPSVILALGNIPLRTLTGMAGEKQGISMVRGFCLPGSRYNLPIVPSFHPSYINRGNKHFTGVLIRDIGLALQIAEEGIPEQISLDYHLDPSINEAWGLADMMVNSGRPLSIDIETDASWVEQDESELSVANQTITQVQFSWGPGTALVMPHTTEFRPVIAFLLASQNEKWGQNIWLFDFPLLRKAGYEINGPSHDLMEMWHVLQPDLPKNLQFITSFYEPFLGPWKHMIGSNITFYGARDVDAPARIVPKLIADLKVRKLWDVYLNYRVRFRPILDRVSLRGIPVDAKKQVELKVTLQKKVEGIQGGIQPLIPQEVLPRTSHPKQGYKKIPKEILAIGELGKQEEVKGHPDPQAWMNDAARRLGYWLSTFPDGKRWQKVEIEPFNLGSSKQLISYIEFKGKTNKLYKVPVDRQTKKKTVGEILLRRLQNKVNDPVIGARLEVAEMNQMANFFCSGSWIPGEDGRVHPEFKFSTSVEQLAAERPNSMQFPKHGELAKIARRFIVAPVGFKIVCFDYKAFHAQTGAAEAGDSKYLRLAKMDIHSYVTGHFLKMKGKDEWLGLPDSELAKVLKEIKREFGNIRNEKVKHAILGINNGMQVNKLYDRYQEFFRDIREAKSILALLRELFPDFFNWQDEVRRRAFRDGYLQSKFSCVRYFWDVYRKVNGEWRSGDSSEECIAYLLSNHAHCHLKDAVLRMEEKGWLDRYQLINIIHDEVKFLCPDELVEECVRNVKPEMELRSTVLVYPELEEAKNGLSIGVEASVGQNWSEWDGEKNLEGMREVS